MKYTLTKKEASDLGYILSEKPVIETIEFREDGDAVQSRLISAWMDTPLEILAAWKAKKEMKCERCDHHWTSILTTGLPRRCPRCHSPYWDRPRRSRPVEKITPIIFVRDGKIYRSEYVCLICDIAWAKDVDVLNVDCPRCRRKCGANSRQVEISAEDAEGLAVQVEAAISFDEFRKQEDAKDAGKDAGKAQDKV